MAQRLRILLVNAPYLDLYNFGGVAHYFPLGLGYIASYLEKHGYIVDIVTDDGQTDVYGSVKECLKRHKYLYVGISCMTPAFPAAVRIARIVKQVAPAIPVILGGPHASGVGAEILDEQPEFDFLCLREGEVTCLKLAEALSSAHPEVRDVPGIIWRTAEGQSAECLNPSSYIELDNLPFPARHLVNFQNFSLHSHVSLGHRGGATMITSRGCPFKCIFCSAHLTHGRRYRFHSHEYVMDEIRLLRDHYGVRYIFFEDDSFTVARERLHTLCERMIAERTGITFGCFSRVDVFDEEMARTLSRSGCEMVVFGIESGSQEVLTKIRKGTNLTNAVKAVELCKKYQIDSYASFVVGLPFETIQLVRQTLAFGKKLDASFVMFNPFVPFPGTPLFDPHKHKPDTPEGWSKFLTTDAPPFSMVPGLPPRELRAMIDRAHLRYYLRPRRLVRLMRKVSSLAELTSSFKSFLTMARTAVRQFPKAWTRNVTLW